MTKRILVAAGLIAALAGSSLVMAQSQPGPRRPGIGERRGPAGRVPLGNVRELGLRGIELTDAQREQVRTIMQTHQSEIQQANTKLREAHRAFAESAQAESLNEATLRARSADIASAMAEQAILRARVRVEVLNILTAEQQAQVKSSRVPRFQGSKVKVPRFQGSKVPQ
jgi:protein CpxP